MTDILDKLVASPCCNPDLSLDNALAAYSKLGFRKFEAFTTWCKSAFDVDAAPAFYLQKGRQFGLRFTSLHLPAVDEHGSIDRAVQGARFAEAIDCPIVLFGAPSRQLYIEAGRAFLDAIDDINVTPIIQNHFNAPISNLDDYREVLAGLADPRMKICLEVGHFHSAAVHWRDAADALGDTIALVHIKDQLGPQSVPFGAGEIDLPGLFSHMKSRGYAGDYVVEMEVADPQNTLEYLSDAIAYLKENCEV